MILWDMKSVVALELVGLKRAHIVILQLMQDTLIHFKNQYIKVSKCFSPVIML